MGSSALVQQAIRARREGRWRCEEPRREALSRALVGVGTRLRPGFGESWERNLVEKCNKSSELTGTSRAVGDGDFGERAEGLVSGLDGSRSVGGDPHW